VCEREGYSLAHTLLIGKIIDGLLVMRKIEVSPAWMSSFSTFVVQYHLPSSDELKKVNGLQYVRSSCHCFGGTGV
jgi:hypothetical protein